MGHHYWTTFAEHHFSWTWERLAAILFLAVPIWLVPHFGLMPLRR